MVMGGLKAMDDGIDYYHGMVVSSWCMFSSGPRECQLFSRSPPSATTTTEFTVSTATVQGQCVTTLPTPGSAFGGEAALGGGGGGGTTTTTVMNQLGTVYATKRRRRNGKSAGDLLLAFAGREQQMCPTRYGAKFLKHPVQLNRDSPCGWINL
ncbi:hypothetical protein TcasGA2_TC011104 [Tribolium castaneum]|uniref:Uncharacterized protein n=1 Tax=Tribolium castaneum TaxID=7070 RepID=D6X4A0_TRICA|nr:hypothetical protein TcasGA2_TC011104 [Tribolium castaneum]